MRLGCPLILSFVVATTATAEGQAQTIRLPAARDTWFSEVGPEADGNNGGAPRLKLKSYQEMSLVDFDTTPLKGRAVASAVLHLKSAGEPRLRRVTVGTFGAPWVEGTSTNYRPEPGASTFRSQRHGESRWTPDGGDLCSVILGQGGTTWFMGDASPPDAQGWQAVPVAPAVVALHTAGVSEGFFLFDDTGTEWTRKGEQFTLHHMPNRFVFSREQNAASAPYLTVTLGPEDRSPPPAPSGLRSETADELPDGEALVSWATPHDTGPAGTVGFFVEVGGKAVPRSMVPLAGAPGGRVRAHLRDLGLKGGSDVKLSVRAVDGAGNTGPPATATVRVSSRTPAPLPGAMPDVKPASTSDAALPRLGGAEVAVIDELDKVQPVTGATVPDQPKGYFAANHLWDARARQVSLHAARNEFVAFQVVIRGRDVDARPELTFDGPNAPRVKTAFGRYLTVGSKLGPMPDPVVPLGGPEDVGPKGLPAGSPSQSLHVELYVPHDAPAGRHAGTLTLRSGGETLRLTVGLTVWNFTLPDTLSFLPEMNCYGLPANERDYYRLAHRHRTVLNRVPYSQNGTVDQGCAPAWDPKARTLDFSAWDRRFGPLFDGSAFADLPRAGVPIEVFYLPLHENWPTTIEGNYNGDYWADRAFPAPYREAFVAASKQFAGHLNAKGWGGTLFQCFFNGKVDFKRNGWSRGSSPWLLDEPANFQDFWALRYFGAAFHEGVHAAGRPGPAKLAFRCDISRPQWQRDALDGLLDYNVVSSAMRPYRRIVMDRKEAERQVVVEYGSANPVEEANTQALGWSLDSWSLGADGVLPWQTVGRGDSWRTADTLALFYPRFRGREPVPSVRLKAFRRGQQDVEYLTLLTLVTGEPRWAVGRRVREALGLAGERGASGFTGGEDAGLVRFNRLRAADAWALRVRVGRALDAARPAPKRTLVELRTPSRDPSKLRPSEVGVGVGDVRTTRSER
jgi:hypothetical protein